jgi:hypothetical protein
MGSFAALALLWRVRMNHPKKEKNNKAAAPAFSSQL